MVEVRTGVKQALFHLLALLGVSDESDGHGDMFTGLETLCGPFCTGTIPKEYEGGMQRSAFSRRKRSSPSHVQNEPSNPHVARFSRAVFRDDAGSQG